MAKALASLTVLAMCLPGLAVSGIVGGLVVGSRPLTGLDVEEFRHPNDARATDALKKVPGLDTLIKKIMEYGLERLYYVENLRPRIPDAGLACALQRLLRRSGVSPEAGATFAVASRNAAKPNGWTCCASSRRCGALSDSLSSSHEEDHG